jgi:hypothetical protein
VPATRADLPLRSDAPHLLAIVGFLLIALLVVLFVISLASMALKQRRTKPAEGAPKVKITGGPSDGPTTQFQGFETFDEMCDWLADDAPVTSPGADRFGHSRVAERIVERLIEKGPPAQAVVGALGSGKTTLRHLVSAHLSAREESAREIRLVPVELWPYETAKAAVEGVINTLVNALASEVNIVGLSGLSQAYAESMTAAGGLWSALVRAQGVPSNPAASLAAIDEIAIAIGTRYVVWIEDLERFAVADSKEASEEKLNPIRALLYGLDNLRCVSVITATTSLRMRFDIEKIARFVEPLPELSEVAVGKVLGLFRRGCIPNPAIIDPAGPRARRDLQNLGEPEYIETQRKILGPGIHTIMDAICYLSKTPRTLKFALRGSLSAWKSLAGEIDFDDLLVLSILRESHPNAFALVQEHIHHLRGARTIREQDREEWKRAWDAAFNRVLADDPARSAVEEIVKFVFGDDRSDQNPQGARVADHTDYWERLLSIPRFAPNEGDQPVLRALMGDSDDAILNALEAPGTSSAVEHFRHLVPTQRLRRLFLLLVGRRSTESAAAWKDHDPPGLIPLWRMWNRRGEAGELGPTGLLEDVKQALDIATPRNLALTAEIEQHFVVSSVVEFLSPPERDEAKRHLRSLLVSHYKTEPDRLAQSLAGARKPVLQWLVWDLDRVRAKDTAGIPFDGWEDFASALISAAQRHPEIVLPQLAWLVVREGPSTRERRTTYEVDDEMLTRLFGRRDELLELFRRRVDLVGAADAPEVVAILAALSATSDPVRMPAAATA